jgi:hypothetical protein
MRFKYYHSHLSFFQLHMSKYMANGGIDKFTWLNMVTNEPYPKSWIPKYEYMNLNLHYNLAY